MIVHEFTIHYYEGIDVHSFEVNQVYWDCVISALVDAETPNTGPVYSGIHFELVHNEIESFVILPPKKSCLNYHMILIAGHMTFVKSILKRSGLYCHNLE